jgi:hypothetical protein
MKKKLHYLIIFISYIPLQAMQQIENKKFFKILGNNRIEFVQEFGHKSFKIDIYNIMNEQDEKRLEKKIEKVTPPCSILIKAFSKDHYDLLEEKILNLIEKKNPSIKQLLYNLNDTVFQSLITFPKNNSEELMTLEIVGTRMPVDEPNLSNE